VESSRSESWVEEEEEEEEEEEAITPTVFDGIEISAQAWVAGMEESTLDPCASWSCKNIVGEHGSREREGVAAHMYDTLESTIE